MTANLNGTYKNPVTGETLIITDADNHKGTFSGTLFGQINDAPFQVEIFSGGYHFFNNVGPSTSISLTAWQRSTSTLPEMRETWLGTTDANNFQQLDMMGVRSILRNAQGDNILSPLTGPFIRE